MLGTLKDMQKRLWRRASLSMGAPFLGNLEEGSSTGDFERMKGALGMGLLSLTRLRGGALGRGAASLGTLEDMFR